MKVTLEDRTLSFALERRVQWKWIRAAGAEPNSPDVVTHGPFSILAQRGCAPAVAPIFHHPGLRPAMTALIQAHPLATVEGDRLRLPDVAEADAPAALKSAVAVVRLLREAIAATPVLSEEAMTLAKGPPWWRDPYVHTNVFFTLATGLSVLAFYGLWIAALKYLPTDEAIVAGLIGSAALVGGFIVAYRRKP